MSIRWRCFLEGIFFLALALLLLFLVSKCEGAEVNPAIQQIGNTITDYNYQGNWCAQWLCQFAPESIHSVSARQMWNKAKEQGLEAAEPRAGDLVFFWRESINSWKGHCGLIIEVGVDYIITIEGNKGGEVKRCRYNKPVPKLLGYGRAQ